MGKNVCTNNRLDRVPKIRPDERGATGAVVLGPKPQGRLGTRSSSTGLIFDLTFTLYHIICVTNNMIFAIKCLVPQTLNQYYCKNTNCLMNNKNIYF